MVCSLCLNWNIFQIVERDEFGFIHITKWMKKDLKWVLTWNIKRVKVSIYPNHDCALETLPPFHHIEMHTSEMSGKKGEKSTKLDENWVELWPRKETVVDSLYLIISNKFIEHADIKRFESSSSREWVDYEHSSRSGRKYEQKVGQRNELVKHSI